MIWSTIEKRAKSMAPSPTYLLQSSPDLLHVGLIGGTAGVHPLGDLIDVPADGAQSLCHLLDVGGAHLDDISVNRHFLQVCPYHFVGSCAIFSSMSRFSSSVSHKGRGLSQQAQPVGTRWLCLLS